MMKNLLVILFSFIAAPITAQVDSAAYTQGYEFKEGIYLTETQFLQNHPIPISAIVSTVPKTELDFLTQVLEKKKVMFKNEKGLEQQIASDSIWGYCQNKSIYLNFNHTFNRLNVIGSLCHFTSEVRVMAAYPDPFYYNRGMTNSYNELRQFILNIKLNRVYEFSVSAMEDILESDPALYTPFMKLKKRNKENSIFIYLRKYNESHPLYIYN